MRFEYAMDMDVVTRKAVQFGYWRDLIRVKLSLVLALGVPVRTRRV